MSGRRAAPGVRAAAVLGAAVALALTVTPAAAQSAPAAAAEAFLAALSPGEAREARLAFDAPERRRARLTPSRRAGLPLKEMSPAARAAARAFLAAALSAEGVAMVRHVREREALLRDAGGGAWRDPDLYYLAVFGRPNAEGDRWGWRLEGHHLSYNFTYEGARLVSALPLLLGSNPESAPGADGPPRLFGPLRDVIYRAAGGDVATRADAMATLMIVAPEPFRSREARRLAEAGALLEGLDGGGLLQAFGGGLVFLLEPAGSNHLHVSLSSEAEDFGGAP